MTTDADNLVAAGQKQLGEHMEWLATQIAWIPEADLKIDDRLLLVQQARQIALRVVRASAQTVSVVWDYPDELYAWLSSERAPKHLRDTLAGGHVVDPNQPASTWKRVHGEG